MPMFVWQTATLSVTFFVHFTGLIFPLILNMFSSFKKSKKLLKKPSKTSLL